MRNVRVNMFKANRMFIGKQPTKLRMRSEQAVTQLQNEVIWLWSGLISSAVEEERTSKGQI